MASQLLSFAGWYILPDIASTYLQAALYSIFIRAGEPKPTPGSWRYMRDRKRVYIFVTVAYLLYTVYEAHDAISRSGDFYQILNLPHNVDERGIQSRFRRLTVQFHPDKAKGADSVAIEAAYVRLQLARDTLVDPTRRFAYDRLGPEILGWQHSKTIEDHVVRGLQQKAAYYAGSVVLLLLLGMLGYLPTARFWRYLVMAGMFAFEIHVTMRPTFPTVLSSVVNPFLTNTGLATSGYLPFQLLIMLRKCALTFFIALNRLGPLLHGVQTTTAADGISSQQLDRLDALGRTVDQEASRLMGLELIPFMGEQESMRELRTGLKEWLVQNTIRNDAEVSGAIKRVLDRRSQDTDAGDT